MSVLLNEMSGLFYVGFVLCLFKEGVIDEVEIVMVEIVAFAFRFERV